MKTNWFKELNDIDVSEHIEQKNGLSYLSWMWAWSELKKRYPLSYATVHETEDGMLVWKDPLGGHVKTTITLVWDEAGELREHSATEYLPIMDFKNKSVPYENIDAMMVNKTVQRSLTKCIARLGLGAYIYAGEDLPEVVAEEIKIKEVQSKEKAKALQPIIKGISETGVALIKGGTPKEKLYEVCAKHNDGLTQVSDIKEIEIGKAILEELKSLLPKETKSKTTTKKEN